MEGAMDRRKRPAQDELAAVRERAEQMRDHLLQKYKGVSAGEAEPTLRESLRQEREKLLAQEQRRLRKADFEHLCVIGRGAFGEIRLVRHGASGDILALKTMNKSAMVRKKKVTHVHAERDCMARADNPWIVKLYYSFHDANELYMAMEFLPGGDLMQLLVREDTFTEQAARFYIAQAAQAVATVHQLGYAHRDLKPDNILLDARGHIKLTDMGLAKKMEANVVLPSSEVTEAQPFGPFGPSRAGQKPTHRSRTLAYSTVGTPDYIAPEVFGNGGYGCECDWWSLGVILFECLCGYTPFFAESPVDTCKKILSFQRYLAVPEDVVRAVSPACMDFMLALLRPRAMRLGSASGIQELREHPWLSALPWAKLRDMEPPFVPEQSGKISAALEKLRSAGGAERDLLVKQVTCHFDVCSGPALDEGDAAGEEWCPNDDFEGFSFKRKGLLRPAMDSDLFSDMEHLAAALETQSLRAADSADSADLDDSDDSDDSDGASAAQDANVSEDSAGILMGFIQWANAASRSPKKRRGEGAAAPSTLVHAPPTRHARQLSSSLSWLTGA